MLSSHQRGYGAHWRALRRIVLERDGHRCKYCGGHADTVDHIIPKALGGTDALDNLTAACGPCNYSKGDKPPAGADVPEPRHSREW